MIRAMLACVGVLLGAWLDEPGRPDPSVDETYREMKAAAGRDAGSQVRLALWCEAHGLEREKLKHLAVAVLTDPTNAMARGLMGLVEYKGKWAKPEAVVEASKVDVAAADLAIEYKDRRLKAPVKPEAQYKLALWCIEKGLIAESRAHLATVVRLDPGNAEAWKKLGYRKANGRWVTEAMAETEKAEREAQAKADKEWSHRLARLRDDLGSGIASKREAARTDLATVSDPRAVPMVWKVFIEKGEKHHLDAVQLLGQIDAAMASRALALLAVADRDPVVRGRATETLKRKDPREFAGGLIVLLQDKINFDVKAVGGPGSPGELYIEGKKENLKRVYAPPTPWVQWMPGDTLVRDGNGMPVLVHHERTSYTLGKGTVTPSAWAPASLRALQANPSIAENPAVAQMLRPDHLMASPGDTRALILLASGNNPLTQYAAQQGQVYTYDATGSDRRIGGVITEQTQFRDYRIPVGQMMAEAQKVALSAQAQLEADVAALKDHNRRVAENNAILCGVLKSATGESIPDEPKPWRTWFVDQLGFAYKMTASDSVPTVVESVPLAYQPQAVPIQVTEATLIEFRRHSCFAKGTKVWTLNGPRPIEELNPGDQVLSQETKTGKLRYRPVLMAHRNPPSPTFRIGLDSSSIVTSPSHRFWVAGRGWVMARDLKVGDPIRTLGGLAKVAAIEADKVQPVFNLDVADDADFFAGPAAALVHDNTLPDLRQKPFDAPEAVAAK